MKKIASFLAAACAAFGVASAVEINFDDQGLTGPSFFSQTSAQVLVINAGGIDVTFSGGALLGGASNLPGNQTVTYGTADFLSGGLNPITITFSESVDNFFLDIFNGNTVAVDYTISDGNGTSQTFNLPANNVGGFVTAGLIFSGTQITITGLTPPQGACCDFDFFIDNINFNAALPPGTIGGEVPVPAALPLFLAALGAGGITMRRRKKAA